MSNVKGPKVLGIFLFFFGRLVECGILRYIKKINHCDFLLQLTLHVYGSTSCNLTWFVRKYPLHNPYGTTHFAI